MKPNPYIYDQVYYPPLPKVGMLAYYCAHARGMPNVTAGRYATSQVHMTIRASWYRRRKAAIKQKLDH